MVFKDLEGTKQARKELAEKESKVLLALQGKSPKAKSPFLAQFEEMKMGHQYSKQLSSETQFEMMKLGFEDYKQFQALFKDEYTNTDLDSEVEILTNPMFLPKPDDPHDNMSSLKSLLEAQLDIEDAPPSYYPYMGVQFNNKSPAYLAYKKKMNKLHKRKLLKTLIKKHGTDPDVAMVDNVLTDAQVDEMIIVCLKLDDPPQGEVPPMPQSDLFGHVAY